MGDGKAGARGWGFSGLGPSGYLAPPKATAAIRQPSPSAAGSVNHSLPLSPQACDEA